ncbi:MAG TPA: hypothetical protein VMO26_29925 [Vicinamibacterales bacterium]|nr:hypothetical protein [Vicinamibacterales bacterium]
MRFIAILVAAVLVAPAVLSAQSLASVAKKEEERRKSVKASGKVYTNNDLKADITASSAPAPTNASADAPTPSTQVPSLNLPGGTITEPDAEVKDEAYWRSRMTQARSALERLRIFADALQSRLNALASDIVNRDDPAQRAQLELERQRAFAEMERVAQETADQTKAIADIEEEARKAGVPPGWLR